MAEKVPRQSTTMMQDQIIYKIWFLKQNCIIGDMEV